MSCSGQSTGMRGTWAGMHRTNSGSGDERGGAMIDLSPVYAYVDEHADRMVADLQRLIRQPSISSANLGVRECAELLVEMMGDVGITARVIETDGLPVVYGEINSDRPEAPTLLIYTHYDVQPADPESDWESPPFEARRVGDRIIGRGATDA